MKKEVFEARILERIRVQEENIKRELARHKENPKLTYKQLWESSLNAIANDADGLKRAYDIKAMKVRQNTQS